MLVCKYRVDDRLSLFLLSEISSLVKNWEGGQKYMLKTKIPDVIDAHLPLTIECF